MLDRKFTSCGYVEMGTLYLGSTGVGLDEALLDTVTAWFTLTECPLCCDKIGYYLPVSGHDLG